MASGKDVYYLVVETTSPYLSYTAPTTVNYIKKGAQELGELVEKFKLCMTSKGFLGGYDYFNDIVIDLPWSVDK